MKNFEQIFEFVRNLSHIEDWDEIKELIKGIVAVSNITKDELLDKFLRSEVGSFKVDRAFRKKIEKLKSQIKILEKKLASAKKPAAKKSKK